jgi:hypothetical protein
MKPREDLSEDVVGVYNHGAKALNLRARLVLEGRKLIILNNDGEMLSAWPLREIRDITPEGVVQSLRLALNNTEERLNITNADWAEEIRRLSRNLESGGGGGGSSIGRVLVLLVLAAIAAAAYLYTR